MASPRCVWTLVLSLLCSSVFDFARQAESQVAPSSASSSVAVFPEMNPALPALWIVGNSGVRSASDTQAGAGWNSSIAQLFDLTKINLIDRSDASSSLRDYIANQRWSDILSHVRPGDFVLIQFAYRALTRDSSVQSRGSLPGTSDELQETEDSVQRKPELVHTFGWYLREYAVETIARGATPILCSPAPSGSTAPDRDSDIAWTKAIAIQQRIPFIDLSALPTRANHASASSSATGATLDGPFVAEAIVSGLKGMPSDPLAGYFSAKGNAVAAKPPPAPLPDTPKAPPS